MYPKKAEGSRENVQSYGPLAWSFSHKAPSPSGPLSILGLAVLVLRG